MLDGNVVHMAVNMVNGIWLYDCHNSGQDGCYTYMITHIWLYSW